MKDEKVSPIVAKFKLLLKDEKSKFPWSKMLSEKEMRFVYDLVARSETERNYLPTSAQAKWGLSILKKLELSKKEWKSKNKKFKKPRIRKKKPKPMPSTT